MDQSFPASERLLNKQQFDQVFKSRKKLFSKAANLFFCRNECKYARLGVITSKRNQKRAVDRNLIRRHCRELFRRHKHLYPGFDIVVLTTRSTNSLTKAEQITCLKQLFERLAK
jgi:ribonuclease P protein component